MGSAAKPLGTAIATITAGWSANRKLSVRANNSVRLNGVFWVGLCAFEPVVSPASRISLVSYGETDSV